MSEPTRNAAPSDEDLYLDPREVDDPMDTPRIPRKRILIALGLFVVVLGSVAIAIASHKKTTPHGAQSQRIRRAKTPGQDPLTAAVAQVDREAQIKKLREDAAREDEGLDTSALTATAQPCPFRDCRPRDEGEPEQESDLGKYASKPPPGYNPGQHYGPAAGTEDESKDDSPPWTFSTSKKEGQQSAPSVAPSVGLPTGMPDTTGLQNTIAALKAAQAAQGKGGLAAALGHEASTDDDRKEAFVDGSGIGADISGERDRARCEVRAGEPIHVSVNNATNSDLPAKGVITAIVTKDVMGGARHDCLAIPQGSEFTGSLDARVAYGQERQLLCMNRLYRPATRRHPNGTKLDVGCMVAADVTGQVGMPAEVNNHWAAMITGSLLSALLGTAPSMLAGNQQGFAATIPQQLAASAGQNMNQVGQRVVQRELQRKPTLETPMLEFALVFANRDIELDPWDDSPVSRKKARASKYAGLRW